jgi:hypothetical protein
VRVEGTQTDQVVFDTEDTQLPQPDALMYDVSPQDSQKTTLKPSVGSENVQNSKLAPTIINSMRATHEKQTTIRNRHNGDVYHDGHDPNHHARAVIKTIKMITPIYPDPNSPTFCALQRYDGCTQRSLAAA